MRARRSGLVWCVLTIIALGWNVGSREVVMGRVSPTVGIAPTDVVIEASIEPNAANRSVVFAIESSEFYTSSSVELDGEHAARTTRVRFRTLPAGLYTATVTLFGPGGERGSYACTVDIV